MSYKTYTGKIINTTSAEFVTARGAKISVVVLHNVRIGRAGDYLDASTHIINLSINGASNRFCDAAVHPDHGYSIMAPGLTIPVPAANIDAVKGLIDSVTAHNAAVEAAAASCDEAYHARTAAITKMMEE